MLSSTNIKFEHTSRPRLPVVPTETRTTIRSAPRAVSHTEGNGYRQATDFTPLIVAIVIITLVNTLILYFVIKGAVRSALQEDRLMQREAARLRDAASIPTEDPRTAGMSPGERARTASRRLSD